MTEQDKVVQDKIVVLFDQLTKAERDILIRRLARQFPETAGVVFREAFPELFPDLRVVR